MKKPLGAGRILANISALKGFTTKRELADFFGVGPSAVTDWTNRKGDKIPEKRLAELCRTQGLSWDWLVYGEGRPFAATMRVAATNVELAPSEMELLARVKNSPAFKKAVERLANLPEEELAIVGDLAASLRSRAKPAGVSASAGRTAKNPDAVEAQATKSPANPPFLKWNSRYPLTANK